MRSPELTAVLALATLGACGDQSGMSPAPIQVAGFSGIPTMNPGWDCMYCHYSEGNAHRRPWTVAGTVFKEEVPGSDAGLVGAEVLLTDATGKKITLVTNEAGNFYTGEDIGDGGFVDVQIQWQGRRMRMNVQSAKPTGKCNSCHSFQFPLSGVAGRLYVIP
jgi:hypothetical protein